MKTLYWGGSYWGGSYWGNSYWLVLVEYAEIWDGIVIINMVINESVILNKKIDKNVITNREITDTYLELEVINE